MRYWIFDEDDTPQGYPLQKLIRGIRRIVGDQECALELRRSEGYGLDVNRWGELLDAHAQIAVDMNVLEAVGAGTEQWFHDLDAACTFGSRVIRFGLHDSHALFLEVEPELGERLVAPFADVRVEDG